MAIIGYARVSTDEQTIENQQQQIEERYKIDHWFYDEAVSGTTEAKTRTHFKRLLDFIREGDTLVVVAIDRLGRSVIDVRNTVDELQKKGVTVLTMREGFDLTTDTGKAMLTIMAALAELEISQQKARRQAGIKRAQSSGVHCGRPRKSDSATVNALFAAGKTWQEIAEITGLSKASIYRLKAEGKKQ